MEKATLLEPLRIFAERMLKLDLEAVGVSDQDLKFANLDIDIYSDQVLPSSNSPREFSQMLLSLSKKVGEAASLTVDGRNHLLKLAQGLDCITDRVYIPEDGAIVPYRYNIRTLKTLIGQLTIMVEDDAKYDLD